MLLFSRTIIDFIRTKILLHIGVRINVSLISDFFMIKTYRFEVSLFSMLIKAVAAADWRTFSWNW